MLCIIRHYVILVMLCKFMIFGELNLGKGSGAKKCNSSEFWELTLGGWLREFKFCRRGGEALSW